MGGFTKILIFFFLSLFTLISLADTAQPKIQVGPPVKRVDVTINKNDTPKQVVRVRSARRRLIDWIRIPWVDIGDWNGKNKVGQDGDEDKDGKGDGDGSGGMNGDGDGSGGAGGKGKGKGNGNNIRAVGFGYDDNAKKTEGDANRKAPPQEAAKQPPAGPPPPQFKDDSKAFDKWWPVCVFIPPDVADKGNEIVKTMVDMSAKTCQVNLEVVVRSIPQWPNKDDANKIIEYQRQMCNIPAGFGVQEGSTLAATTSNTAADMMCTSPHEDPKRAPYEWSQKVAGCAVVRAGEVSVDDFSRGKGGEKLGSGTGILPSIIDFQGLNGRTAAHEAIGHSQMGWPNGKAAGVGIGRPKRPNQDREEEDEGSSDWTQVGCTQMRAKAYGNDGKHRWDANRQYYYVQEPPARQHPLGQPVFDFSAPPPQRYDPPGPPAAPPGPPAIAKGDPPASPLDSNFGTPRNKSGPPQDAGPPGGHKKLGGIGTKGAPTPVVSARSGTIGKGTPEQGTVDAKADLKSFGYDESNKKLPGDPTKAPPSNVISTRGYGYDESFNKKTGQYSDGTAEGGAGGKGTGGGGPGSGAAVAGADAATAKDAKDVVAGGDARRGPASIADDVKAASANLDDDFFKKLRSNRPEDEPKIRGTALRRPDLQKKSIYQGGSTPSARNSPY